MKQFFKDHYLKLGFIIGITIILKFYNDSYGIKKIVYSENPEPQQAISIDEKLNLQYKQCNVDVKSYRQFFQCMDQTMPIHELIRKDRTYYIHQFITIQIRARQNKWFSEVNDSGWFDFLTTKKFSEVFDIELQEYIKYLSLVKTKDKQLINKEDVKNLFISKDLVIKYLDKIHDFLKKSKDLKMSEEEKQQFDWIYNKYLEQNKLFKENYDQDFFKGLTY